MTHSFSKENFFVATLATLRLLAVVRLAGGSLCRVACRSRCPAGVQHPSLGFGQAGDARAPARLNMLNVNDRPFIVRRAAHQTSIMSCCRHPTRFALVHEACRSGQTLPTTRDLDVVRP